MEDKLAREKLAEYCARYLALRDIVARLLSYHAQSCAVPLERLTEFSEQGVLRANKQLPSGSQNMQMAGIIQDEFDRIISAAHDMLSYEVRKCRQIWLPDFRGL